MKNFTVEEINLMCCFNTSCRKRLIDDMKSVCNLVRRTEKGRLRRRGWGLRWEKAQKGGKGTNLRGFFED